MHFFYFSISKANDVKTVSRSCYWEDKNASKNDCMNNKVPPHTENEFCETCDTDGCNGASQFGPVALLITVPVAIAKILSL